MFKINLLLLSQIQSKSSVPGKDYKLPGVSCVYLCMKLVQELSENYLTRAYILKSRGHPFPVI